MDDYELFATKDEALAFIRGLKAGTDFECWGLEISKPMQLLTGEWKVEYSIT